MFYKLPKLTKENVNYDKLFLYPVKEICKNRKKKAMLMSITF
jgi:hypothetical protein